MGIESLRTTGKTQSGYETYENVTQKAENVKHTAAKAETAKQKRENAEYETACQQLENYFTTGEFKPISLPIRQREDSKNAGASFEYGDLFMKSATNGYLNDKGNDGLTKEDAKAGGYKLAELQSHSDPYKNPYNHQGGAKSDYYTISTEEDLIKAYEAFGYTRSKAPKPQVQPDEPVQPLTPDKPLQPVEPVKFEEPGQFAIGTEAQFKSTEAEKNAQQAVDDLIEAGVIKKDEAEIDIDFSGTVNEGKASKTQATANGSTVIAKQGNQEDVQIAKDEVKKPVIEIDGKKYKTRMNKNGELQVKRTGLFRTWKDYHKVAGDPAPVQEAKNEAPVQEVKTEAKVEAKADPNEQAKADFYKKHVADEKFWSSHTTFEPAYFGDDNERSIYQVKQVTTDDGKRILQVNKLSGQEKATNYYEVKVDDTQGYMRLAPDLSKELQDVQLAK